VRETALQEWLADLEKRHLADLTFAEVSRALRALSSAYVERRASLAEGRALEGAGKRAAFALFYAPLHFMTVDRIVAALSPSRAPMLVDIGCGTGAAGAAWADASSIRRVVGIDRSAWALGEAGRTYRQYDLAAQLKRADAATIVLPKGPAAFLAAFTVNELPEHARERLLTTLVERCRKGGQCLVVEPLARFVAPWWQQWKDIFQSAGGRADEWRFRVELPPIVAKLDRAAGLDHRELTARTLWLEG
jgi:SAM-dependent methyltransferase